MLEQQASQERVTAEDFEEQDALPATDVDDRTGAAGPAATWSLPL